MPSQICNKCLKSYNSINQHLAKSKCGKLDDPEDQNQSNEPSALDQPIINYMNGKTMQTEFLDNGQFEILKRDAFEYTNDPIQQEFLVKYIVQLQQKNVTKPAFDLQYFARQYNLQLPEQATKQFDTEFLFSHYKPELSTITIKTKEQFSEYFACAVCYSTFDAKSRICNKSCSICSFNACQACYNKLDHGKQCPSKCKPDVDTFAGIPKYLFAEFTNMKFQCNKCNEIFNTVEFQDHVATVVSCQDPQLFNCPLTGCRVKNINRLELQEHLQKCTAYESKCQHCFESVKHSKRQAHSCITHLQKKAKLLKYDVDNWLNDANNNFDILAVATNFSMPLARTIQNEIQSYINRTVRNASVMVDKGRFLTELLEIIKNECPFQSPVFVSFTPHDVSTFTARQIDTSYVQCTFEYGQISAYFA